jgi:hypothetical protein
MRLLALVVLSFIGCAEPSVTPAVNPNLVSLDVSEALVSLEAEGTPHRLEVRAVEGESDLYVAVRDWQTRWWGDFLCFRAQGGRIQWIAEVPDEPTEQSILAARGFRLKGFRGSLVEVFGMTHMGNGSYYLYELVGDTLQLLLETRAVDRHWADGNLIRGDHLDVTYHGSTQSGGMEVVFTGIVDQYPPGDDIENPIRSTPCRKVFIWNDRLHRFEEDKNQRQGFESYGSWEQ